MRDARPAPLVVLFTLAALLATTLSAGPGAASTPASELDTAALASVRDIQERFEQALRPPVAEHSSPSPGEPARRPEVRTYIVTLEENQRGRAQNFAEETGGDVVHVYDRALTGFSVDLVPQAAEALRQVDRVVSVEEDQPAEAATQTMPTGVDRVADPDVWGVTTATLGIDTVDGARVNAGIAVLDSGVAVHPDLNLVSQVDCTRAGCPSGGDDRYGHGTHVAGSAAAIDNGFGVVGVAHGARIYSVKALGDDGGGYFSDIIAGIDWATARPGAIDVINMSLSGRGHLDSLDRAIDNAVGAGIAVVVAAGNNSGGAVDVIPASHPDVLAVSALADTNGVSGGGRGSCSGSDDHLATISNFGANIDVVAPGACILSTLPGGYGTKTGTSMAAPHVAGAAALLAANGRSVDGIRSTILGAGNFDWVDTSGDGRKEPLLDVSGPAFTVAGAGSSGTTTSSSTTSTSTSTTSSTSTTTSITMAASTTTVPSGGNRPPTAIINYECRRLGCRFDGTASSDSDGAVRSFEWDFGDGSRGSGSVVQHTYQRAGSFTVTLTLADDDGAAATATRSLNCTLSSGRVTCR
ncbi:MAG TPA: S8 family serine peptidase [Acidimicrobiales bacterium]|nr:S8 family serine peptidase [Acidimicrobiales bacterium]